MTAQKPKKSVTICPWCQKKYMISTDLAGRQITCRQCEKSFIAELPKKDQEPPEICKIAMHTKVCSKKQIAALLKAYDLLTDVGSNLDFDDFFYSAGLISPEQRELIEKDQADINMRRLDNQFCTIAIKNDFLSSEDAEKALNIQARQFKENETMELIGDILVDASMITKKQRDIILIKQKRLSLEAIYGFKNNESEPEYQFDSYNTDNSSPGQEELKGTEPSDPETPNPPKNDLSSKKDIHPQETLPENLRDAKTDRELSTRSTIENTHKNNNVPASIPKKTTPSEELPDKKIPPLENSDEKQHPAIFDEKKNKILEIIISEDNMTAELFIYRELPPSIKFDDLMQLIHESKISHGNIKELLISEYFYSEKPWENSIIIARGKEAEAGRNASVKYHFEINYLRAGNEKDDGTIDYKDRGDIPHVSPGDLLVEKTPLTPKKNGYDIFGNEILVPDVKDIPIRTGSGAYFSDDGLTILAEAEGQPQLTFDGKISVIQEKIIKGDVGLETGHVNFDGNLIVRGVVKSDFKIKCAGLTTKEIGAATIIATGDIIVQDGINGATIKTEGSVYAKYISNSKISAYGDVIVTKEIIESQVQTSGRCSTGKGKFISSNISSKLGIETGDIGTEKSIPCILKIGADDQLNSEIAELELEIKKLNELIETYQSKQKEYYLAYENLETSIVQLAHIQDRGQLEISSLNRQLKDMEDNSSSEIVGETKIELEKIQSQIEEKLKKIDNADKTINEYFKKQEKIQLRLPKITKMINKTNLNIDIFKYKKETLIKGLKKQQNISSLKAGGKIFPGTVISGNYCKKTIGKIMTNIQAKEHKQYQP